jgi:glycine cleavage system H protein
MHCPNDLLYTKDHEWVRVIDGNIAYVGITDFAQRELGEIVFIEIEDSATERESEFGSVESVKSVSELYLPVSGTIIEVNEALIDEPELANDSPYNEGWMIKIEMSNLQELNDLMNAEQYSNYLKEA